MTPPPRLSFVPSDWDTVTERACRSSLYYFLRWFWPVIEPNPFIDNWHIGAVAEHLQAVTEGQIKRLIITIPPGCSKSLCTSVFWPAWEWIRRPQSRWFFVSYDQRLSTRDSGRCRALIKSREYQHLWGTRYAIAGDADQKTYYETSAGGYRLASSVDGHGTGQHPNRVVVDDPLSAMQAESELERQRVLDWWDLTMSTRGVSLGVSRVIIMQRLHENDLAGHLLRRGDYVHLCLPMRFEPGRMKTTPIKWNDPRTVEGELLTPQQFSEDAVRQMEISLGAYGTASQLQQRPRPKSGGMFKAQWFNNRLKAAPYNARRIRYWDRACLVAGTMVDTAGGLKPIERVIVGDRVLTRQGYKRVTWSGETKKVRELVTVEFSNGIKLSGTDDHPVWTENRGWVTLADLRTSDYCINSSMGDHVWQSKEARSVSPIPRSSCFKEWLTDGDRVSDTFRRCDMTGLRNVVGVTCYTGRCGDFITATSQKDSTFITRTITGTITTSQICSACLGLSTTAPTGCFTSGTKRTMPVGTVTGRGNLFGGMPLIESIVASFVGNCFYREVGRKHPLPYVPARAVRGNTNHLKTRCVRCVTLCSPDDVLHPCVPIDVPMFCGAVTAFNAEDISERITGRNFVAPSVVRRFTSRLTSVYDLTVEDAHEFFANGVLVHNSSTTTSACFTAGVLMAQDSDGNYYVEDVVHGKWEPDERNAVMRATAIRDRSRYGPRNEPRIYVEREGGSSGRDAWKSVARALNGFAVWEDTVTGKKDVRAEPWAAQLAAGNVYLIDNGESQGAGKAAWDIDNFVREHLLFKPEPNSRLGRFKDLVDASSGAFNLFVNELRVQAPRIYSFKKNGQQPKLRLLVCTEEELALLVEDELRCLLVSIGDVGGDHPDPVHGIRYLLGTHKLQFADLDPRDHQATWDRPVPPYGKPVTDLVLPPAAARDMWKFILKQRDGKPYEAVVIQGSDDRRAFSVACGIADQFRLPRKSCIELASPIDTVIDGMPVNQYVIDQVKAARERLLM